MIENGKQRPNKKEVEALTLFYNRFYFLYDEISNENFKTQEPYFRFYRFREAFSVFKEISNYEPIKEYLKWMKRGGRPFFEGVIADDLFSFIRNLLLHFPIFDTWDEVYINKSLATWDKAGQINKFLTKVKEYKIDDKSEVKYRIWEVKKKKMTYFSIKFPSKYNEITNIYLKDIITEEMGMKFCMALMRQIINTQIENPEEDIKIMSQVYLPRNNNDL